jgi:ubiquitin C-terminal hydrolase
MNSGVQCISHIKELTDYFLKNEYVKDINKNNPLGSKGKLCTAFAKLLQNLWYGDRSYYSPIELKKAIDIIQPMFSGYNQHDAGELIAYVLDGLH